MRTMKKAKNKIRTQAQISSVGYGAEPTWNEKIEDNELHLIRCLNWYNYCATANEEKRWLIEWAKSHLSKSDTQKISKIDAKGCVNVGRMARMKTLGCPLDLKCPDRKGTSFLKFETVVDQLIHRAKKQEKKNAAENAPTKKSVQDYIRENFEKISGDLNHVIDEQINLIRSGKKPDFNFEAWVKDNNIATIYMRKIYDDMKPMLAEFKLAASKKDPQLTEGYSIYKAKHMKMIIELLENILAGSKTVAKTKKKRVYRKRKPKDVTKVVAKVKYLSEHKELGIRSLSPTKILEAKMAVIYNTKYNIIEVYEASVGTLSVKGARIVNYDPKKTYKQRIRKPKELLKHINDKGVRAFKNAMKDITTVKGEPSGLIGPHSVILLLFA